MIIYKITNTKNGKVYIGQTTRTLRLRWEQHIRNAKNGGMSKFYKAIRKYGPESFKVETLCTAYSKEELNDLEIYFIHKYNSIEKGYNMIDARYTNVMDFPDVKEKHKRKMTSPEIRKRISEGMKKYRAEHPFTDEHRRKLSEKAKQRVYPKNEYKIKTVSNRRIRVKGGDTRSIGCYCILEDGTRKDFHSYRDAWMWWKTVDNPFKSDAECVFQRKIKQSISLGYFMYGNSHKKYEYPKWYKGGDLDDKEVGES